ncbi:hypothetical protein HNV12_13985 [Methanococcoides sp. SA1]|nr:hypothetical protein [Methanococcoides sp. SA1]
MDTLTTVAIAIAAFLGLIVLTAMELKTASVMHKNSSSPQQNIGGNGCNTDKNECTNNEKECNGSEDECDDVIQDQ